MQYESKQSELKHLLQHRYIFKTLFTMLFDELMTNESKISLFKKDNIPDAIELIVWPADEDMKIDGILDINGRIEQLIGTSIQKGDIIESMKKSKKRTARNDSFEDVFESVKESFHQLDVDFEVVDTVPDGIVKITKSTKVKLLPSQTNADGIPKSLIINLAQLPNLSDYYLVNDIKEIIKVANDKNFINRFETKSSIVYITCNYFYEKIKVV